MSIYTTIMIIQLICLVITAGSLTFFYTEKQTKHRDNLILIAAAALLTVAGYALFLQTTDLGGLRVAQKIYLTGKIAAPAFLAMLYLSALRIEKSDKSETIYKWLSRVLLAISLAAEIFICSDTLQKLVFNEPVMEQNQYFYYISETMTGLSTLYLGLQFCLLIACSGGVLIRGIRNRISKEKQGNLSHFQMEILFLIPLILLSAEGISFFPKVRHYDLSSLAAAAVILLLIPATAENIRNNSKESNVLEESSILEESNILEENNIS